MRVFAYVCMCVYGCACVPVRQGMKMLRDNLVVLCAIGGVICTLGSALTLQSIRARKRRYIESMKAKVCGCAQWCPRRCLLHRGPRPAVHAVACRCSHTCLLTCRGRTHALYLNAAHRASACTLAGRR